VSPGVSARLPWIHDDPLADDDRPRCAWAGTIQYRRYHDEEWGSRCTATVRCSRRWRRVPGGIELDHDPAQAPRFREVFAGFEPDVVAEFGEDDIARLMADAGIIRNRAKIEATIGNAALVREMADGELDALMWSFAPAAHGAPADHVRGPRRDRRVAMSRLCASGDSASSARRCTRSCSPPAWSTTTSRGAGARREPRRFRRQDAGSARGRDPLPHPACGTPGACGRW
jgi:3-methyladenine DNA glycosylase Tag